MPLKTTIFFFFYCVCHSFAQGEGNIWYFGEYAGLDFNSGSPVVISNSAMITHAGCATISDASGSLLFYTNGSFVWDSTHNVMPNSTGLLGDDSSTNAGYIVPHPNNLNLYYIFTTTAFGGSDGFRYSLVDMSLNGGLGDVTNEKNVLLHSPSTEKIAAVMHADGNAIWVVAHDYNSNQFRSYLIDDTGLNTTPVITSIGFTPVIGSDCGGAMKISPDGSKLCSVYTGSKVLEFFEFDNASGTLSNLIHYSEPFTATGAYFHGVEFSPNSQYVYLSNLVDGIFQFDVSNFDATSVINSRTHLPNSVNPDPGLAPIVFADLQLGPDGKIYNALASLTHIGVINSPNNPAATSDFVFEGVQIQTFCLFGLPSFMPSLFVTSIITTDTCLGDVTQFEFYSNQTIDSIQWDFGDGTTSALENPTHTYTNPGTYTVMAEFTSNGATNTKSKEVIISEVPIAHLITDYQLCTADGNTSFDLTTKDAEVLNGQSNTAFTVAYYHSLEDAENHTNSIASPYVATETNEEVFVKVYNSTNVTCYDITSFNLITGIQPVAYIPENYIICETVFDGISDFDLQTKNVEILDNQDTTLFEISYHLNQNDADTNSNPLSDNYSNISNPQTIFVRIENTNLRTCYDTTSFELTVVQQPAIGIVTDYLVCDDSTNDGIADFDLSSKNAEILNGQPSSLFEITYYSTETDVLAHSNQLPNLFTNTNSPQQVFVKINAIGNLDCFNYTSFNLSVSPTPIATQPDTVFICDDPTNDGNALVMLDAYDSYVLDGQSPNDYSVTYYSSLSDADEGIMSIDNQYTITNSQETLFVRVESIANVNCYDTTILNIELSYQPIAYQPDNLSVCDDPSNDGIASFDLSEQDVYILNGQSSVENQVSYFLTQQDANTNENALIMPFTNSQNPQTVYARVENSASENCFSTTSFDIVINEQPQLLIEDLWSICENDSIELTADAGYDEYLWSTGEATQSIIINNPGTYELTVTNIYGDLRCETSKTLTVFKSEIAAIIDVETIDFTQNNNAITIYVEGNGDYEYSLDGITYQDSHQFTNLTINDYIVYVRDKRGCGIVTEDIYLLYYPKFFTPNNDGYNDAWQLINSTREPNNVIYIFDRYGKLLKQLSPTDRGWDGTINGNKLPSNDYWFVLQRQNGKQYKGHFTLKR